MMKNHKFFGAIACSVIALTISSCGKEDKIERFPEGTSMIKMMDEDNGGTTLGNSNVYMTSSGNFKSNNLPILDCGKKSGIGDIGLPDFTNMAPEVAVIPGHGYVICDSDNVKEFPSRKKAIREDALMYRVYVDSWIQTCGKNVGANVYFLLGSPLERGQIPEMDSDLGTLAFDLVSHKSNSISVKLPSEDIEVIINDKTPLACSTKGRTLTLTLTNAPMSYETGTWSLSIRSGRVYTKATVAIEL